jgi:hypothetical protein
LPASLDVRASKRDLVARVATLELLVSDLVHILWRLDPNAMDRLAGEAAHDLDIHHHRVALAAGEHQRERLYTVLDTRRRMLRRRAGDPAAPAAAARSPAAEPAQFIGG